MYYKAIKIRTALYWLKKTYLSMKLHWRPRYKFKHIWTTNILWRSKKYILEKKQQCCWSKWVASHRRTQQIYTYHPVQKPNSKCNKNLNVRSELLNMVTENMGNSLEHIGTGKDFLSKVLRAHVLEQLLNRVSWNYKATVWQRTFRIKDIQNIFHHKVKPFLPGMGYI